jgi:hypothetical protein
MCCVCACMLRLAHQATLICCELLMAEEVSMRRMLDIGGMYIVRFMPLSKDEELRML